MILIHFIHASLYYILIVLLCIVCELKLIHDAAVFIYSYVRLPLLSDLYSR